MKVAMCVHLLTLTINFLTYLSQIRADYKLVAKALGRIGSAYSKKGDLPNAIKFYEKSLTEHRTPDVLSKLKDAEKAQADATKKAYINPELSAKAREEGNDQFKGGDFASAVKSYTESIKRDPNDPRGYNNRAAAYMKLAAFPEALKDTEEAIKVDPSFSEQSAFNTLVTTLTPP
jgi:stress-induced-phosphoprotein 1